MENPAVLDIFHCHVWFTGQDPFHSSCWETMPIRAERWRHFSPSRVTPKWTWFKSLQRWLRSLRSIWGLQAKETLTPIPLNVWGILRRQTHINQLRWPGKLFTAARWVPVRRHDECALFVSPFHTVWRIGSAWRLWIWNDLNWIVKADFHGTWEDCTS